MKGGREHRVPLSTRTRASGRHEGWGRLHRRPVLRRPWQHGLECDRTWFMGTRGGYSV